MGSRKRTATFAVSVACDGVGDLPGSGRLASAVCKLATETASIWIRGNGLRKFQSEDEQGLVEAISTELKNARISEEAGTTIAICISGYASTIALWAGDSRAYSLDRYGDLSCISEDHQDDDGSLTNYVDHNGIVVRGLSTKIVYSTGFSSHLVTTDGVHEECTLDELKSFLLFSVYEKCGVNAFSDNLKRFVGSVAVDNFSAALAYRFDSKARIESRGR